MKCLICNKKLNKKQKSFCDVNCLFVNFKIDKFKRECLKYGIIVKNIKVEKREGKYKNWNPNPKGK
jgi:hypothetical protein